MTEKGTVARSVRATVPFYNIQLFSCLLQRLSVPPVSAPAYFAR